MVSSTALRIRLGEERANVVFRRLSFSVEEGEIFGILGPNGAGKTTAVECVEGLR
ncbi:ATP-binding cassette domain-containing protein, partial [Nonomuraea fuscirosea]